jgi:cytochrome c5
VPRKVTEEQVTQAYKNVFDGPDGELVLSNFAQSCNFKESSYVPGSFDKTAYNEGLKDGLRHFLEILDMNETEVQEFTLTQETE